MKHYIITLKVETDDFGDADRIVSNLLAEHKDCELKIEVVPKDEK